LLAATLSYRFRGAIEYELALKATGQGQ
jgi:hypothetical protein